MPRTALRLVRTPVGLVPVGRPPVATSRLVLKPVARDGVEAFLAGDFRDVRRGDGWPREKTEAGSPPWQMSLEHDVEVNWLVTLDGLTIGDCFTHGGADDAGDIEIGYGLAAPYRGDGYGTELVAGFAGWLILHPEINRVVARNVAADNTPSRRALERAGFLLEDDDGVHVAYAFAPRQAVAAAAQRGVRWNDSGTQRRRPTSSNGELGTAKAAHEATNED